MAEIRWNPLIKDWVMIASHRQDRPQMPKDWCPFCPGSGKVPDNFDVYKYDNDFPALSQTPPVPDDVATKLYLTAEAYGKCEVVLYSPEHTITLPELPVPHIRKLIDLWTDRFVQLSKDEKTKYVFIFENRGEVVGVTMPHPHGQIYAYPFIPKRIELELDACLEHYEKNHSCLICDMNKEEKNAGLRIVMENKHFVVYIPFFSEYPYGTYVVSKAHKQNIAEFTDEEKDSLAQILRDITGTYDSLFDKQFPYMMCMYQNPVNSQDTKDYYHFRIVFFPPMRDENKQKFNASSETGVWAHCNTTAPEEKAKQMRDAFEKFKKKHS
ncbi:MAG: galactose-1-phosphate uridylyltransferase [Eubacteriales bacterium]|jgi:UDPglucose--hexose-1-phosphate uridylyltransferase|nr:galactose-1-phosphate uridylyltransferase [Eubacteriales bacterium]